MPRTPPRPLDVRRGEPYDGRAPAPDSTVAARVVPRTVLFLPRLALDVVLRASEALSGWLERSGAVAFTRRVFWAFDGRLRVLPHGLWRGDMTPTGGAVVATDLLLGLRRRAGLVAEGHYGAPRVFGASLGVELLGLHLTGRPPLPGRLRLGLVGGYDRRADMPFYGLARMVTLGGELGKRARYGRELAWAGATMELGLWRSVALHLRAGFDRRRLSDGPDPAADSEPISSVYGDTFVGFDEAVSTFHGALSLSAGGAQGRLLPEPGWRASAEAVVFAGSRSYSHMLRLDGRVEVFARLAHGAQRLGLRGWITGQGSPAREIPIPFLPSLGGLSTMRGYSAGRFTGESLAWVALEHYAALHPRIWLCLFVEWGAAWRMLFTRGVPRAWSQWDGGGWLGLRVAPGLWLQLQVAGGGEGPQVFVGARVEP